MCIESDGNAKNIPRNNFLVLRCQWIIPNPIRINDTKVEAILEKSIAFSPDQIKAGQAVNKYVNFG